MLVTSPVHGKYACAAVDKGIEEVPHSNSITTSFECTRQAQGQNTGA